MKVGDEVIEFIEGLCPVPEGRLIGQMMKLEPFQKKFIKSIYANKHDQPRKVRRAILAIARKNGKTALIAALLICHLVGPTARRNTQIISGAMSRDQAGLVFKLAQKMINLSPVLEKECRIVPSQKMIVGLSMNVEYKALSADGSTAHGLSPVLAIMDEVGQIRGPTSDFVEAILTSQGAHDEPLQIFISTQASSDSDFLSVMMDDAKRTADKSVVLHQYSADDDGDLMDRKQWKKANPAMGTFRSEEDLRSQLEQAARLPSMEASARNLLLNQRISLTGIWLAPSPWKECCGEPNLQLFKDNGAVIGLDLSARIDLTAAVLAQTDEDGVTHLFPYVFTPLDGVEERSKRDRAPYADWIRDGYMIGVSGSSIDYDFVAEYLRNDLDDKGIDVTAICFDRWRIDLFKKAAEECGAFPYAEWIPVGQGYKDMSPRCEAFEAALLSKRMRTGSHPLLNLAAANAVAIRDPAGNIKIDKAKASQRIDPLIAAIMALYEVTESDKMEGEFDVAGLVG